MIGQKMKILTIVGARPQFIKAAMVSRRILNTPGMSEILVHTGQHYDANMSDSFFSELEIPAPTINLGIGSSSHGRQTGRMLEALESILENQQPDCVMVYGDTNSTLSGALAAVKLHIPVAHVEAGLRSFNERMPEEINRIVTDHISRWLFAPTQSALDRLAIEGISPDRVHLVGDVMYDAALHFGELAQKQSRVVEDLGLSPRGYLLATVHRAENTDDPNRLRAILSAIKLIAMEIPVVFPLHPRTRAKIEAAGFALESMGGLKVIPPVGYLDMVMLEVNARAVATDSGGVQKESFFYKVPCVTLREETEWRELLELGWNRLAPPLDEEQVLGGIRGALSAAPGLAGTPYGDGHAADRILSLLSSSQI